MNEDKELLLLAAKAIGYNFAIGWTISPGKKWNPLTDDGDALRLAAALDLRVDMAGRIWLAGASNNDFYFFEVAGTDKMANIRRAIVKVAAELGKTNERT